MKILHPPTADNGPTGYIAKTTKSYLDSFHPTRVNGMTSSPHFPVSGSFTGKGNTKMSTADEPTTYLCPEFIRYELYTTTVDDAGYYIAQFPILSNYPNRNTSF